MLQRFRDIDNSSLTNYLFIIYCIIWDVLAAFFVSIDGYGRLGMILLCLAIIVNIEKYDARQIFRIPAIVFWIIWIIVEFIRWQASGLRNAYYPDSFYFTYYNFIRAAAAMIISAVEMRRDAYLFLRVVLYSFLIYVFLGLFFQLQSGVNLQTRTLSLGNMLPLSSVIMIFVAMAGYYFSNLKKRDVWIVFGISMFAILMCATRKAFGGLAILFVIWYCNTSDLRNARDFFILIFGGLFLLFGVEYIMDNTSLGERLTGIEDQSSKYTDNLFLKYMGDRAIQYMLGWKLFLKNMIWGVGILNFQHYSGFPFQLHTEYMVQLAECGIVGTVIFLLFYFSIFKMIYSIRNVSQKVAWIFVAGMLCVMFINFTAWTFNLPVYFICYGIIIGGCYSLNYPEEENVLENTLYN